jgi:hypothetical protein
LKGVQARARGIPGVIIVGRHEGEGLVPWYAESDVLVVPSRREVWGHVVHEGLAAGLHVIATEEVGAAGDLLSDGLGTIIPARDVPALREAMTRATLSGLERREDPPARRERAAGITASRFSSDVLVAITRAARRRRRISQPSVGTSRAYARRPDVRCSPSRTPAAAPQVWYQKRELLVQHLLWLPTFTARSGGSKFVSMARLDHGGRGADMPTVDSLFDHRLVSRSAAIQKCLAFSVRPAVAALRLASENRDFLEHPRTQQETPKSAVVMVTPERQSGGIKLKSCEAAVHPLPIALTSPGIEGTGLGDRNPA